MRSSLIEKQARVSFGMIIIAVGFIGTLIYFCPANTVYAAVGDAPSEDRVRTLQFTAGGHVIGFQSAGLAVGTGDNALRVAFAGARDIQPQAEYGASSAPIAHPLVKVTYPDLWDGVTLIYSGSRGIFESTYHVVPQPTGIHRQVEQIRLRYNVPVSMDNTGNLVLAFKTGQMRESAPVAWQMVGGQRVTVESSFRILNEHEVGFRIGACNPTLPLIIDPVLTWNTFLGSAEPDRGFGIAVDDAGYVYVSGFSYANWGTPLNAHSGGIDAFVARLDANGSLVWNTFLGSDSDDNGYNIAADSVGNIHVAGDSDASWGVPLNAHAGGIDAFVARLDANGSLVWNTFLGSADMDHISSIVTDDTGNIYLAGSSHATWGAPLNAHAGNKDVFVARLDANGSLVWNTFLGSVNEDGCGGIAVDDTGDIYLTGTSETTWGTPLNAHAGSKDVFVARLNADGSLVWNTFFGSDTSNGNAITADNAGNLYVTGVSLAEWGSPLNAFAGGNSDAFLARLNAGSGSLDWHTFMGSFSIESGYDVAADGSGNIYVTGFSSAPWGAPIRTHTGHGAANAFAARLDAEGGLLWNTFLGSFSDSGTGLSADADGNVYVSGYSDATWEAPINAYAGSGDVFAVKLPTNLLTVSTAGSGSGVITSNPTGIDCASTCRDLLEIGEMVTLSATPDAGMGFYGWSGGECSGSNDCVVTMIADTDITATFYDRNVDWDGDMLDNVDDPDDDNDGVEDVLDAFPFDGSESLDNDGDGTGDNADADDDNDGVDDETENSAPNNGDNNADTLADSLQNNVASLPAFGSDEYITLEALGGAVIKNCRVNANPSPADAPSEFDFPHGFFGFRITGVINTEALLKIYLPADAAPDTYYKYGPTSDNVSDHWYEFMYDGETGAEIEGRVITLHFKDARRGDDILTNDEAIVDIGAPGVSANSSESGEPTTAGGTAEGGGGGGGGCFIDTMLSW